MKEEAKKIIFLARSKIFITSGNFMAIKYKRGC